MKSFIRKLGFVASFLMVCAAIVAVNPHHANVANNPAHCFNVFVHSLETETADGTWACLSADMREGYFVNGWQSDADIQRNLYGSYVVQKLHFEVLVFKGNPINVCAPSTTFQGASTCIQKWLVHYKLYNADGTVFRDCTSIGGCNEVEGTYAITLAHGLISNIEKA